MTSTGVREQRVVETLLALTDTLVTDYHVLDLMTMLTERAVELLGVTAAGVLRLRARRWQPATAARRGGDARRL